MVRSVNTVLVDEAALDAEVNAALAAAPSAPDAIAPPGQPAAAPAAPAEEPESWAPIVESVTVLLRDIVLMQWQVTPEQWRAWEQGWTRSLDACFPGGIKGKYGGFVQAGLVGAGAVTVNWLHARAAGRKFPPLGPPERAPAPAAAAAAPKAA